MDDFDLSWMSVPPCFDVKMHKEWTIDKMRRQFSDYGNKKENMAAILSQDTDPIPKVWNAGVIVEDPLIPYQVMHNGMRVKKFGYGGAITASLIYGLKGHHETQEERVFYEVLKYMPAGATMIELGAAWGYYSLWFMHAVMQARAILVEPFAEELQVGKDNFRINGKEGTFIHGYVGTPPTNETNLYGRKLGVDELLAEQGLSHVHLLHADIQGSEGDMLLSAENSLKRQIIDYFFISTHSESLRQFCIEFLTRIGYSIVATHSQQESWSADGLVVARRWGALGTDHVPISLRQS